MTEKEYEKLINSIMKEAEKDGEPLTREEAGEVAKMEIGAKEIRRYEQSDEPKKPRKPREKKVDEDKMILCEQILKGGLDGFVDQIKVKSESEINFSFSDEEYTIKLIRHRKSHKNIIII